jgi:hypothetical protein
MWKCLGVEMGWARLGLAWLGLAWQDICSGMFVYIQHSVLHKTNPARANGIVSKSDAQMLNTDTGPSLLGRSSCRAAAV